MSDCPWAKLLKIHVEMVTAAVAGVREGLRETRRQGPVWRSLAAFPKHLDEQPACGKHPLNIY